MKNYSILLIISIGLFFSSCQDWLDVKPLSEVAQEDLFASEDGYVDALNGIYVMLGENAVYGDQLTMSFLDVLAQNYYIPNDHAYIDLIYYNYETEFGQNKISSIWSKMYNIIANCNNIIEHLENDDPNVFSGNSYKRILGETKALRAMLHFDLLRMFNAPYESDPDFVGIPYVNAYKKEVTELSTTTEALTKVLEDLNAAYRLLEEDEIKSETGSTSSYRENRMNAYAVSGMLARVYLYTKDYSNAALYADEVIQSERFSLMDASDILKDNDFVFYSEQVFGLYSTSMGSTANNYFTYDDSNINKFILICSDRSADWYDGTDIRFKYWYDVYSIEEGDLRLMQKFNRPTDEKEEKLYTDPVLPLIKLPEMVLILAECQAQTDLIEGIQALNILRENRQANLLDEAADMTTFMTELGREYEREFYSEGQLFYFYKRMNYPVIIGADGSDVIMNDSKYTLPFPADEIQFGGRLTN